MTLFPSWLTSSRMSNENRERGRRARQGQENLNFSANNSP